MDNNIDHGLPRILHREDQSHMLSELLSGVATPGSIFMYGHTATGKTYVATKVIESLGLNFVCINCVECDSIPLLVAAIAAKLSDVYIPQNEHRKCTTLMDLINLMQRVAEMQRKEDKFDGPFVIMLERCERLRMMPNNTMPALLKLQEFSDMKVSVLLFSDIIWEKFYTKMWFIKPIKIFFPLYSRDEIVNILCLTPPDDLSTYMFKNYVNIVVSLVYRYSHDLNEIRYVMHQHLPKIRDSVSDNKDINKLFKLIQGDIKKSIFDLHLRGNNKKLSSSQHEQTPLSSTVSGLELPYYAKYLLISAFLSSYNASKHDKRLFMKFHGKEQKRLQNKKTKKSLKMSSLLVGPKQFNFERLVAIFNSITDTSCDISTSLCAQLTTLVNLKLIHRVGYSCLNDPRYTCAVGLNFVENIGKEVGFSITKYIMEDN